ncbi:MAG: methylenetetrahydrofolate reductase [Vampirovibrionales bacterium]
MADKDMPPSTQPPPSVAGPTFAQRLADTNTHALTLEISPPKGSDAAAFLARIKPLAGLVDAINVPDCQRAILKMSSLAASKLIQDELNIEAVWQLTTRDRNLLALQGDVLGAWAMGIRTILPLTGDPVQIGDHAHVAKAVSHLDSLRLIDMIREMNQDLDATGKTLPKGGTRFTYGAALNPHRMSRQAQITRIQAKIAKQVQFFQTQPVYDLTPVKHTLELITHLADKEGVAVPKLLIGIIPPKSAEFARFMNKNIVGIEIPDRFIEKLEKSADPKQEAITYCADLMATFAPYVDGFHIMPVGMEKSAPVLMETCHRQQVFKR